MRASRKVDEIGMYLKYSRSASTYIKPVFSWEDFEQRRAFALIRQKAALADHRCGANRFSPHKGGSGRILARTDDHERILNTNVNKRDEFFSFDMPKRTGFHRCISELAFVFATCSPKQVRSFVFVRVRSSLSLDPVLTRSCERLIIHRCSRVNPTVG